MLRRSRWKQEKLDAGTAGVRTMRCALQVLAALFRHARRFGWTSANPLENLHRPRHAYSVQAFTPTQIATLKALWGAECCGHRLRPPEDDRSVFTSPEGGELAYSNWRIRRRNRLLEATAPDARDPKRMKVTDTPHMLRHSYATALLQSGENAQTVQPLMGQHSAAFTMDQYADAWSAALSNAGEKVASLLFAATGSKTVAPDGRRIVARRKCLI